MCKYIADRKILSVIQKPLELIAEPFEEYAQKLGISVEQLIFIIQEYIRSGVIRRFAGIVKHDRAGYNCNAMVAFEIDENLCDTAGESLSSLPYVTHCYCRTTYPDWPYNIYAMMHARNEMEFQSNLKEMKAAVKYRSMEVLKTKKEYKKTQFLISE